MILFGSRITTRWLFTLYQRELLKLARKITLLMPKETVSIFTKCLMIQLRDLLPKQLVSSQVRRLLVSNGLELVIFLLFLKMKEVKILFPSTWSVQSNKQQVQPPRLFHKKEKLLILFKRINLVAWKKSMNLRKLPDTIFSRLNSTLSGIKQEDTFPFMVWSVALLINKISLSASITSLVNL